MLPLPLKWLPSVVRGVRLPQRYWLLVRHVTNLTNVWPSDNKCKKKKIIDNDILLGKLILWCTCIELILYTTRNALHFEITGRGGFATLRNRVLTCLYFREHVETTCSRACLCLGSLFRPWLISSYKYLISIWRQRAVSTCLIQLHHQVI